MAFVFRPKGRKNWYYRYKDPARGEGRKAWVTKAGTCDKRATQKLADDAAAAAARRAVGLAGPLDGYHARPLAPAVAAYKQYLADKGDHPDHVSETHRLIVAAVAGLGWKALGEVNGSAYLAWLGRVRAERGMALGTANHYLRAAKGFTRWLVRDGRLPADPLAHLSLYNDRTDRRRVRRALSTEEFARLIASTRARPRDGRERLVGPARAALYLTAAYTGLRAKELGRLSPGDFDLAGDPPTVSVPAAGEKARRGAVLPLHPDLVRELSAYLSAYLSGNLSGNLSGPCWPGSWAAKKHAAQMLRRDLEAAGIPYRDEAGRYYDFHALRTQLGSALARAGVGLQAAQKLLRHSDPRLTANVYTHLSLEELAAEVAKLPGVLPDLTKDPRSHGRSHGRSHPGRPDGAEPGRTLPKRSA